MMQHTHLQIPGGAASDAYFYGEKAGIHLTIRREEVPLPPGLSNSSVVDIGIY